MRWSVPFYHSIPFFKRIKHISPLHPLSASRSIPFLEELRVWYIQIEEVRFGAFDRQVYKREVSDTMLTSELVQGTYALYTLLILQKYLGNFLLQVRSYDLGLFGEKVEEDAKEAEKESSRSYYVGKIKQWVIATTGITAAYLTGSMQYVLPIVNVLITGESVQCASVRVVVNVYSDE